MKLSSLSPLSSMRFNTSQFLLQDWALLKVSGNDRESFFQGQVTNDLSRLKIGEGHLTARLNRAGKLQSFFFIAKNSDHLLLLCPKELSNAIKSDFEKYIISEDVIIEALENPIWLQFNILLIEPLPAITEHSFDFIFYGINARLVLFEDKSLSYADGGELDEIRKLNGWPVWGKDINETNFINDSYLNEIAISYKKGCFLGQETVSKIENNRGAAYYPVLLKLNNEIDFKADFKADFFALVDNEKRKAGQFFYHVNNFLVVTLFRDLRVLQRKLTIFLGDREFEATVDKVPLYQSTSKEEIALELYYLGVEEFQKNNFPIALSLLEKSLAFNLRAADTYESLGVMLGRVEKYQEAIGWMDKLLAVNPNSVMAHTNKSLYLMKLGKIEEAEAEKSLATVKSFAYFGEESKQKKQAELDLKKKESEMLKREGMFLQVLEIDKEDTIALYGMADIYFMKKDFESAIKNLEKVIIVDPKYSTAYLLLGKAFESLNAQSSAISTYQAGILVASRRGDMMPANEMQSRLNQLVMRAGHL